MDTQTFTSPYLFLPLLLQTQESLLLYLYLCPSLLSYSWLHMDQQMVSHTPHHTHLVQLSVRQCSSVKSLHHFNCVLCHDNSSSSSSNSSSNNLFEFSSCNARVYLSLSIKMHLQLLFHLYLINFCNCV